MQTQASVEISPDGERLAAHMAEDEYTKREINLMLVPLHDKLDAVLKQVATTNGRVKSLELWRSFLAGGFAVLSLSGIGKLIMAFLESGVKP